ncbi:MAG: hypothetical protein HKN40_07780, partial [Winogradskyella sp.]|uniref:alpha/beta hydrolase-fold protein n=1 Tax=Winogradskyella sp. TaxID=1883156 RepID=UPI0017D28A1E|nr:hypothetical protein [Winogradskyella sp.]
SLVVNQSIVSNALNDNIHFYIYIPDAYKIDSTRSFPVVYWLHGSGGWPPGILNVLANRFHLAIKDRKIPPTVIVFLDDGKRESGLTPFKLDKVSIKKINLI